MARLYADEQFPRIISELLRTMGHTERPRMATRIDEAIASQESLKGKLIRIVRPAS